MEFRAGAHTAIQDHVQAMGAASAASQFSFSLVYGNLPMHIVSHIIFAHRPISHLLVPLSEHVSQRYYLHIFR